MEWGEGRMNEEDHCVGSCKLCGSKVMSEGKFFDSGDGYLHKFCIAVRKRAM